MRDGYAGRCQNLHGFSREKRSKSRSLPLDRSKKSGLTPDQAKSIHSRTLYWWKYTYPETGAEGKRKSPVSFVRCKTTFFTTVRSRKFFARAREDTASRTEPREGAGQSLADTTEGCPVFCLFRLAAAPDCGGGYRGMSPPFAGASIMPSARTCFCSSARKSFCAWTKVLYGPRQRA
jgi:hypothetical protein